MVVVGWCVALLFPITPVVCGLGYGAIAVFLGLRF